MRKKKRKKHTKTITKIVLFSGILIGGGIGIVTIMNCNVPEKRLMEYMKYIEKGEYEQMYAMLDQKKSSMNSKEEFIERNSKIYEGIEMSDLSITDITVKRQENGNAAVSYTTNMQTAAGNVEFTNDAVFSHDWTGYHLIWQDQLIFPELSATDKVQVTSEEAKRGDILDRNGRQLAGEGTASSVGIVPGRMENREDTIKKLAEYLGIGADEIEDKLKADWVKADSFVPVATIPKIQEVDLLTVNPDETVLEEKEKQDTLLKIPGIMLSDVKVRTYYLKEAASHLVGYVQAVTAEDLQEHKGEGYRTNSVIGKTGLETLYEKELKGTDGCEICIVDANGNKKSVIAYEPKKDGEDIHTTIDGDLQSTLYEQFKEETKIIEEQIELINSKLLENEQTEQLNFTVSDILLKRDMDFINKVKLPISYYAFNDNWDLLDRDIKADIIMRYVDDIELEMINNTYEIKQVNFRSTFYSDFEELYKQGYIDRKRPFTYDFNGICVDSEVRYSEYLPIKEVMQHFYRLNECYEVNFYKGTLYKETRKLDIGPLLKNEVPIRVFPLQANDNGNKDWVSMGMFATKNNPNDIKVNIRDLFEVIPDNVTEEDFLNNDENSSQE